MNYRCWVGALALAVGTASAQAGGFSVFGSRWDPKDGDKVYGGGASLALDVLPIEIRGTYYEEGHVDGLGDVQVIPVEALLALDLASVKGFRLSAIGGLTYGIVDADHGDVDNEWGWNVGGRVKLPLGGGSALLGEWLYRRLDLDGGDMSGAVINLGFTF